MRFFAGWTLRRWALLVCLLSVAAAVVRLAVVFRSNYASCYSRYGFSQEITFPYDYRRPNIAVWPEEGGPPLPESIFTLQRPLHFYLREEDGEEKLALVYHAGTQIWLGKNLRAYDHLISHPTDKAGWRIIGRPPLVYEGIERERFDSDVEYWDALYDSFYGQQIVRAYYVPIREMRELLTDVFQSDPDAWRAYLQPFALQCYPDADAETERSLTDAELLDNILLYWDHMLCKAEFYRSPDLCRPYLDCVTWLLLGTAAASLGAYFLIPLFRKKDAV